MAVDNGIRLVNFNEDAYRDNSSVVASMATLREFDSSVLPQVGLLSSIEIKDIRKKMNVSQAVFAKCLNVSLSTVKQWERGEKKPRGTALLLLHLVSERGLSIVMDKEEEI